MKIVGYQSINIRKFIIIKSYILAYSLLMRSTVVQRLIYRRNLLKKGALYRIKIVGILVLAIL